MRLRFPGLHPRVLVVATIAGLVLGPAGAALADVQMKTVRWRAAADSSRIDGFRVYVDASPTGGRVEFEGPLAPGTDGVYSVAVPVTVGATIYVRVSAYNSAGESPASATDRYDLVLPPSYEPLGQPGQPQVVP